MAAAPYDVSVILPFGDDEELVGRAVRRVAEYLGHRGDSFEILCIDEDSGDNSHAVLGLVRAEIPEVRVAVSAGRGRGVAEGVSLACGKILWILSPQSALSALSAFGVCHGRVMAGGLDVFVVDRRFSVCRRTRVLELCAGLRGGVGVHDRLAKRALSRDLNVENYRTGTWNKRGSRTARRPWSRLLEGSPLRAALGWIDG